jgi:hypothetical protein
MELCPPDVFSRMQLRRLVEATEDAMAGKMVQRLNNRESTSSSSSSQSTRMTSAAIALNLRLVDDFSNQLGTMFRASFFSSFMNACINAEGDLSSAAASGATVFSLTLSTSDQRSSVLSRFALFIARNPAYVPSIMRLYRTCFRCCKQSRSSCLSLLTFSTPTLLVIWRWLEFAIGCPVSPFSPSLTPLPTLAPAGSAPNDFSSISSTSTIPSAASATPKKAKGFFASLFNNKSKSSSSSTASNDPADETRVIWESIIWSAMSDPAAATTSSASAANPFTPIALVDALDVFTACYGALLFVTDDDEFIDRHLPFDHAHTLLALAKLLKTLVFRMLWHGIVIDESLAQSCQQILMDMYRRDVRQPFTTRTYTSSIVLTGKAAKDAEKERKVREKSLSSDEKRSRAEASLAAELGQPTAFDGRHWVIDHNERDWHNQWHRWIDGIDEEDMERRGLSPAEREREREKKYDSIARLVEVVYRLPFAVTFEQRVRFLRGLIEWQKATTAWATGGPMLSIRRKHVTCCTAFRASE